MKKANLPQTVLIIAFAAIFLFSCENENSPVTGFLMCTENCTGAALEVKDAYLKDPQAVLQSFSLAGNETGYDKWLDVLRDSFFFQASNGLSPVELSAVKEQMINAAQPFAGDKTLGPLANRLIEKIGTLAILAGEEGSGDMYTGTFAYELPNEGGAGELKISQVDDKTVQFSLMIVAGPPAYNQGMMEGNAAIISDGVLEIKTAEYGGPCRISVTLDGENAVLKTLEGDSPACGFGNNVRADGTYKLISAGNPFAPIDPANLEGNWVSTEDPKSEVKISGGRYLDIYEGKQISDAAYAFFASCPAGDCETSDTEGMSCIKVSGEDVRCYWLLVADGERLEISMIGGRGNTLAFRRK